MGCSKSPRNDCICTGCVDPTLAIEVAGFSGASCITYSANTNSYVSAYASVLEK